PILTIARRLPRKLGGVCPYLAAVRPREAPAQDVLVVQRIVFVDADAQYFHCLPHEILIGPLERHSPVGATRPEGRLRWRGGVILIPFLEGTAEVGFGGQVAKDALAVVVLAVLARRGIGNGGGRIASVGVPT